MLTEAEKKVLRKERDELQAIRDAVMEVAYAQASDELEVDSNAIVSMGEDGAFVQAWMFVDRDDVALPDFCYNHQEEELVWPVDCANPVMPHEFRQALSRLLGQFRISYGQDFYKNEAAKEAAVLLARANGVDPIEDQTCYLSDDL